MEGDWTNILSCSNSLKLSVGALEACLFSVMSCLLLWFLRAACSGCFPFLAFKSKLIGYTLLRLTEKRFRLQHGRIKLH